MNFRNKLSKILHLLRNNKHFIVLIKIDDTWNRVYGRRYFDYTRKEIENGISNDIWNEMSKAFTKNKSDNYIYSIIVMYYLANMYDNYELSYTVDKDKFLCECKNNNHKMYFSFNVTKNKKIKI